MGPLSSCLSLSFRSAPQHSVPQVDIGLTLTSMDGKSLEEVPEERPIGLWLARRCPGT